jgi:hypothetical protein
METIEKKKYPSQVNSKTISARIPVQDYVNFLKESLSKGISLNDFILLKIYNDEEKVSGINETKFNISYDDIVAHVKERRDDDDKEPWLKSKEIWEYMISHFEFYNDDYVFEFDSKEKICRILWFGAFIDKSYEMMKHRQPNITDVKVQINRLVKDKIHRADQMQFLREITELLKELE